MQALADRVALEELMNRYARAIDLRQWGSLDHVFAAGEIEADFTSMGVRQPYRGPASGWIAMVRDTINGFDATQHFFANHSADIDGDAAVDTRYMQARHVLGAGYYTIGGYYTGHMTRTPQGWRIARYKLTVSFTDGDRRLMGIAYRKATGRL
jgi:hypothetical protein